MKEKNSNTLMLLTGIVAGAAAVYFLKSDKGKKMVDLALTRGEEIKSYVSENSEALIQEGKTLIGDLEENAHKKVDSMIVEVKSATQTKLDAFNKGIDKAQAKLNKA